MLTFERIYPPEVVFNYFAILTPADGWGWTAQAAGICLSDDGNGHECVLFACHTGPHTDGAVQWIECFCDMCHQDPDDHDSRYFPGFHTPEAAERYGFNLHVQWWLGPEPRSILLEVGIPVPQDS